MCYAQRGEPKKAVEHLRKMLDAADELGIASDATELLRGLVECADGNAKKGRAILRDLRDATKDASTKKSAEEFRSITDASVLGVTPGSARRSVCSPSSTSCARRLSPTSGTLRSSAPSRGSAAPPPRPSPRC